MTDPIDTKELRRLLEAATPGPWFFNSYSTIFSEPKSREYSELEFALSPDAPDEDYENLPESRVAFVPVIGGDTATEQGLRDGLLIVSLRNAAPALLYRLESLEAEKAELVEALRLVVSEVSIRNPDCPCGLCNAARVLQKVTKP